VTHLPFLSHVARKHKPILFSTGMSYLGEIDTALRIMRAAGAADIALLHCISSYPADPLEANLSAIRTLQAAFQIPIGFSDHSQGLELAPLAVALGARIIEKHFTLDPTLPGPDQKSSLAPPDLDRLIRLIRQTERLLGDGLKRPMPGEQEVRRKARRSLAAGRDLAAGTEIQTHDLIALRPGDHLSPAEWEQVVNRRLKQNVRKGTFLTREMLT
jgi:N-acetylneuraminate synthase/N,N'-diacetyllegionaminate synthase